MMNLGITLYPHFDWDLIALFAESSATKVVRDVLRAAMAEDMNRFIMPPQVLDKPVGDEKPEKRSITVALNDEMSAYVQSIDSGYRSNVIKNMIRYYFLSYPIYLYMDGSQRPEFSLVLKSSSPRFTGRSSMRPKPKQNKKSARSTDRKEALPVARDEHPTVNDTAGQEAERTQGFGVSSEKETIESEKVATGGNIQKDDYADRPQTEQESKHSSRDILDGLSSGAGQGLGAEY